MGGREWRGQTKDAANEQLVTTNNSRRFSQRIACKRTNTSVNTNVNEQMFYVSGPRFFYSPSDGTDMTG